MQKLVLTIALLLAASIATPASSATKWMASNGSGSTCSRSAPCGSPNVALENDELHCADSLQAANFTAPFPFSIICDRADLTMQFARYLSATSGVVVLDGVNFNCAGFTTASGIEFIGSGTLIVRNVRISNCLNGISFTPNGPAKLVITNVTIENNSGVGVLVQPSGTASANVNIDGLRAVSNAGGGVNLVALTSANSVQTEIRNSTISQNSNFGVRSRGGGNGVSSVLVESSSVSNNAGIGLFSRGLKSRLLVSKTAITGNQTGMSFSDGGQLLSYGNNNVSNLTTAGGPSGTIGLQ